MTEISSFLAEIRKEKGFSQQKMADWFQIPQRTWANYETGRSDPNLGFLIKLHERGYDIPGLTDGSAKEVLDKISNETGLTHDEIYRQRIEQLKDLPPETTVENFPPADYKQELNQNDFVVPILDQSLSAGKGQILPDDDNPIGYIAVPKELKRYGNKLAAIYVNGDSMEPTLQRGDLVVCDSCGWDGDGIYALRMDGCGYVKRLARKPGKLVVISDNPKYETWEEPTESEAVSIIGRVHYTLKHVD